MRYKCTGPTPVRGTVDRESRKLGTEENRGEFYVLCLRSSGFVSPHRHKSDIITAGRRQRGNKWQRKNGEKIILCLRLKCTGALYLQVQKIRKERDEQELKTGKYGIWNMEYGI